MNRGLPDLQSPKPEGPNDVKEKMAKRTELAERKLRGDIAFKVFPVLILKITSPWKIEFTGAPQACWAVGLPVVSTIFCRMHPFHHTIPLPKIV